MSSLRIDIPINPSRSLRLLLYIVLASFLIMLAGLANLLLWQYVFILIVTALVIIYLALSRPILLHISQPPVSQPLNQGWQLLMRTSRSDDLWQAQLVEVHRYQALIYLRFKVVEPYHKLCSVTVFRDQVSHTQWQELAILATVTHVQTS